jgi:hypothetical protein
MDTGTVICVLAKPLSFTLPWLKSGSGPWVYLNYTTAKMLALEQYECVMVAMFLNVVFVLYVVFVCMSKRLYVYFIKPMCIE